MTPLPELASVELLEKRGGKCGGWKGGMEGRRGDYEVENGDWKDRVAWSR